MSSDNRLVDRIRYKTWVRVIPERGPGLMSNIEDISSTGLGLAQDKPVVTGGVCYVYFMLPFPEYEQIIQARCRIATCRQLASGGYHVGLAFVEFVSEEPGEALHAIERFLHFVSADANPPISDPSSTSAE